MRRQLWWWLAERPISAKASPWPRRRSIRVPPGGRPSNWLASRSDSHLCAQTMGRFPLPRTQPPQPSDPPKTCVLPQPARDWQAAQSLCPPGTLVRPATPGKPSRARSGFRCRRCCRNPLAYVPPGRPDYRGQTGSTWEFPREAECPSRPNPWLRMACQWLHLIAAEVFVVEVFKPPAQFFVVDLVGNRGSQLGRLEHHVIDENRAVETQGQRQGVARPGVHADQLAFPLQPDQGVKGILFQLVDHPFANAGIEPQQQALDEVVSHGPRRRNLFDLQGDGVRLVDPDPDRKDGIAIDVLQNDDGHIRNWVHHQAAI